MCVRHRGETMRLVKIYTGSLRYDSELDIAVHPDTTGYLFGRGSGAVDWDGVAGRVTWSNFPRTLPGNMLEPRVTGSILLDTADHPILYELNGIAHSPDDAGNRLIVASVRWHTASERFDWLNTSLGVERGVLDGETESITTTTYLVDPE